MAPLADVSCLWNARLGIQTHWSQGAVSASQFLAALGYIWAWDYNKPL